MCVYSILFVEFIFISFSLFGIYLFLAFVLFLLVLLCVLCTDWCTTNTKTHVRHEIWNHRTASICFVCQRIAAASSKLNLNKYILFWCGANASKIHLYSVCRKWWWWRWRRWRRRRYVCACYCSTCQNISFMSTAHMWLKASHMELIDWVRYPDQQSGSVGAKHAMKFVFLFYFFLSSFHIW